MTYANRREAINAVHKWINANQVAILAQEAPMTRACGTKYLKKDIARFEPLLETKEPLQIWLSGDYGAVNVQARYKTGEYTCGYYMQSIYVSMYARGLQTKPVYTSKQWEKMKQELPALEDKLQDLKSKVSKLKNILGA